MQVDIRDDSLIPGSGRSPGGRVPTPVFLPGESHWQEESSRLQPIGSYRVGHNWSVSAPSKLRKKNKGCEPRVSQLKQDPSTDRVTITLTIVTVIVLAVRVYTYTAFTTSQALWTPYIHTRFTTASEVGTITITILHTGEMRQREGLGAMGLGFKPGLLHYAASVSG